MKNQIVCLFALLLAVSSASAQTGNKKSVSKTGAEPIAVAPSDPLAKKLEGKTAPGVKETLAAQADISVETVEAPMPQEPESAAESALGNVLKEEGKDNLKISEESVLPAKGNMLASEAEVKPAGEDFVVSREEIKEETVEAEAPKVVYNPKNQRDPTLSPDDFLLLEYREKQRLAALEAERQRKLAEERRKREEAERLRQLELARIKDPTREVRNKIRVTGIIGQEVFIGSKIYTIGNSIYGARIIEVNPEDVVFSYKGHKFVRKVQL